MKTVKGLKKCNGPLHDNEWLPLSAFTHNRSMKDGKQQWCRACCAAVQREYRKTKKGKEVNAHSCKNQYKRHCERVLARSAVHYAIKRGDIDWYPCEVCFDLNSECHHADYTRKTDVIWTCPKHHRVLDQVRRIIEQRMTGVDGFNAVKYTRGLIARISKIRKAAA